MNEPAFYIDEEQSSYLLSSKSFDKRSRWLSLCQQQLEQSGYHQVKLIGHGAFGYVFQAYANQPNPNPNSNLQSDPVLCQRQVIKFARLNLTADQKAKLIEEGQMLAEFDHANVPTFYRSLQKSGQTMLFMQAVPGQNLQQILIEQGRLSPYQVLKIAAQLALLLKAMRNKTRSKRIVVHGDIKPANLMLDKQGKVYLIDWGSAVFAQLDEHQQPVEHGLSVLMAQHTDSNAKLGDIYFIGQDQLTGALSSPRFDEQGVAATLYALASGLNNRFAANIIPPQSLGLPRQFAQLLSQMLKANVAEEQYQHAGDYFIQHMASIALQKTSKMAMLPESAELAIHAITSTSPVATVVYSSRKQFLAAQNPELAEQITRHQYFQLGAYYQSHLASLGDNEKAFLCIVSYLKHFSILGGLAVYWRQGRVDIQSTFCLAEPSLYYSLCNQINHLVSVARGLTHQGVFKACFFDAKHTLHLPRCDNGDVDIGNRSFYTSVQSSLQLSSNSHSHSHSYFADGIDLEEHLQLPTVILDLMQKLDAITHTGCLIFESLRDELKLHHYFIFPTSRAQQQAELLLADILSQCQNIRQFGVAGYMKLADNQTNSFNLHRQVSDQFCQIQPSIVT